MSHGVAGAGKADVPQGETRHAEGSSHDVDMDRAADRAFASIYPDVNPAIAIGLSTGERIGLAVATGVLAFGGAMGDLIIAGAGLVLVLFSTIAASMKTRRRVRNEARSRFPNQDWAEKKSNYAPWMLGCWAIIIVVVALALFLVPENQKMIGAAAAAVLAAALVWSCPGIAPPRKKHPKKNKSDEALAPEEDDFWDQEDPDAWVGTSKHEDDTQFLEDFVVRDKTKP